MFYFLKLNKYVKSCRHKDFPYYDVWAEWFGQDRATGEGAIGFTEAENDIPDPLDQPYRPNMDGIVLYSDEVNSNMSTSPLTKR